MKMKGRVSRIRSENHEKEKIISKKVGEEACEEGCEEHEREKGRLG